MIAKGVTNIKIAKKLKLTIVSDNRDEAYSFIRQEKYYQNKALSDGMNHVYYNFIAKDKLKLSDESYNTKVKKIVEYIYRKKDELLNARTDKQKEKLKETIDKQSKILNSLIKAKNEEITKTYREVLGVSEQTSLTDYIKSKYTLDSITVDRIGKIITEDFNSDIAKVLKGERALRTYKMNNPLYTRGSSLRLRKEDDNYYFKWIKGIVFKCILGVKKNDRKKQTDVLDKILVGEYKICDSSIEFNKKVLMLNLSIKVPVEKLVEKVKGRVIGVDVGLSLTAVAAINDCDINETFHYIESIWKTRKQMQNRMSKLQESICMVKGGKGRKKKLKALESLTKKEKNFFSTYNHHISKKIVEFALKNKAEQINIEMLDDNGFDDKLLRNWSYSELQGFIKYKAEKEGIKVKYIDPFNTSQTCSNCGHWEEGQRISQSEFKCKSCNIEINADLNAARNIARSKEYVEGIEDCKYYKKD